MKTSFWLRLVYTEDAFTAKESQLPPDKEVAPAAMHNSDLNPLFSQFIGCLNKKNSLLFIIINIHYLFVLCNSYL
jgi:hypothetical protein